MTTFVAAAYFNRYHDIRIVEEAGIDKSPDIDADKNMQKIYRILQADNRQIWKGARLDISRQRSNHNDKQFKERGEKRGASLAEYSRML